MAQFTPATAANAAKKSHIARAANKKRLDKFADVLKAELLKPSVLGNETKQEELAAALLDQAAKKPAAMELLLRILGE